MKNKKTHFSLLNSIRSIAAIIVFCSLSESAFAGKWGVSVGSATWQEKLPVVFQGAELRQKTSFTGTGFGMSWLDELSSLKGWYWDSNASLIVGLADVQQVNGAIAPRRNVSAGWLGNRLIKRYGSKVGIGPNLLVNARKVDGLSLAVSAGLFVDVDYVILEKSILTQSIGTVSDSQELGYFIRYNYYF